MTKRRDRGEGSVSQRKSDGLWRGQIDVGWRDGKRQRKTVYAKTKKECLRKLNDAKGAVRAGDVTTSSMKVEAWLKAWLAIAHDEVKPKTYVDYRSKVEQYLIPTVGRHRLDRLSPAHVRTMHAELRDKGLSETTIHHAHRVLARALKIAMTEVGLHKNVAALIDAPAMADTEEKPLTAAETKRVLDADPLNRARWQFALFTGARQGESLGLQWDRVDLEARTADISWGLQRIPYAHGCHRRNEDPTCGKKPRTCPKRKLDVPPALDYQQLDGNLCLVRPKTTGSIRLVDLPPGLAHALLELRMASVGPNPHNLVWHRPDGRPVDGRVDYAAWQAVLKEAKVAARPLHAARHTAATVMQTAGVPEAVQMQVMGHSKATTTRRYAHVDRSLTRRALAAVENAIDSADDEA